MTATGPSTTRPPRGSPAVSRACGVLFLLAEEKRPLGLTEAAAALGLAKSSALGILTSLEASGLVRRQDAGYQLEVGVVRLAGSYLHTYDVVGDFRHLVGELPHLSREVVQLASLSGRDVVYLARHAGRAPLFVSATPGDTFPASITAVGTALLADLDDAAVAERYSAPEHFAQWTASSTPDLTRLLAKLRDARERGYALDEGETHPSVVGLAVSVHRRGRHDNPLAVGAALRHPEAGRDRWPVIVEELHALRTALEAGSTLG